MYIQTQLTLLFQSASAVEFLKKDLQEFTSVMKEDTSKAAEDVKKQLTVTLIVNTYILDGTLQMTIHVLNKCR